MMTTTAGLQPIGWAALAFAFAVLVPSMLIAAVMTFSATQEVCRRWDVPPRSKPPLTTKTMKSPAHFDLWLAAHDRQPPAPPPYGASAN